MATKMYILQILCVVYPAEMKKHTRASSSKTNLTLVVWTKQNKTKHQRGHEAQRKPLHVGKTRLSTSTTELGSNEK